MAIITISRGTFAGGEQLATLLADRLGYREFSRETLYQRVEECYGFTAEEASEVMEQAPTHLEIAGKGQQRRSLGRRRRQFFYALQATLCRLIEDDDVVYHGQAGHLLLPEISHVLQVRLIAPRGLRVDMAMEREQISRFAASQKIDRVDSERGRWTQSFYGVNWGDPSLFDMVINLKDMSIEEAAEIIAVAAEQPFRRATEASRDEMRNLCLSSQVMARLVTDPQTSHLDMEVEARGGRVKVLGFLKDKDRELVRKVARQVEGVSRLTLPRKVK